MILKDYKDHRPHHHDYTLAVVVSLAVLEIIISILIR